jgi:Ca2+/H+ antiporter
MEAKADSTPPLSKLLMNSMAEADNTVDSGLLVISRGTSILLLVVYVGYLVFQLKTHAYLFRPPPSQRGEEEEEESMSMVSAAVS